MLQQQALAIDVEAAEEAQEALDLLVLAVQITQAEKEAQDTLQI